MTNTTKNLMTKRTTLPSWQHLTELALQMQDIHLNDLFANDPDRFSRFSIELPELLLDFSKNRITEETFKTLLQLAEETEVEQWRDRMFAGEKINRTEDRAVLHTALRNRSETPVMLEGKNISEEVNAELLNMQRFVDDVREGRWRGYSGKRITDIVNLGVGGSNLGPQMVTEALKNMSDHRFRIHYVSNVDATQIASTLRPLNPEQVLFIVSSKSFGTTETLTNAKTAMQWLVASSFDKHAVAKHFVAVTSNAEKAKAYGFAPQNIFRMWDWVGGRFSLWSAIGLPVALDLGYERFVELLQGAHNMDTHFKSAPLAENAPVILALISVWNTTFLGAQSQAILPYDQTLHMLSAYLQQAEMESNGKSVSWNGENIDYPTVPSIWGELGINGQHAFYQYLHQSNNIVPADFIGSVESSTPLQEHHDNLMANFFAQTQALMTGVNEEQVRKDLKEKGRIDDFIEKLVPHKIHKGNRPTNTLLMKRIDAETLGNLIALYEHKIFVQGILLQICSFDQWGVELGKSLAKTIEEELTQEADVNDIKRRHDSSTANLIGFYKKVSAEQVASQPTLGIFGRH